MKHISIFICIITPLSAFAQGRNEPPGIRGYLEEAARITDNSNANIQLHDRDYQYGENIDFGSLSDNDNRIPIENYGNPELVLDAMRARDVASFLSSFPKSGFQSLAPILGSGIVDGISYIAESASPDCTDPDGCLTISTGQIETHEDTVSTQYAERTLADTSDLSAHQEYLRTQIRETARSIIQAECSGPGVLRNSEAIQVFDFTGDGDLDFVFDVFGIRCSTGMMPLSCGAQFCATYFYAFEGEFFTPVAEYNGASFARVFPGNPPTIELFVHGGSTAQIVWTGQSFQQK